MEDSLSNILSQSKYNHKRVNSYTEPTELKLLWCPDGCLVNWVYIDNPYFGRSSILPVFTHITNLIGSGTINSILGDNNWQVSL